jgi:hypothetical protein
MGAREIRKVDLNTVLKLQEEDDAAVHPTA